ncbi:hypothetical protein B0H13DRAFT_2524139 [Mycena leptocephala]|nr:hypothetical protein B0H13DRAFT_2524139 [Mycena leptocephala]
MALGLSENFGSINLEHLTFPTVMRVNWVRVYQDPEKVQVGYMEAYPNANLTTWVDDFHQVIPKNRLADTC